MPIDTVVADANVLLSAVIGKAALRVFTEFQVEVHAAVFNADEVREYLPLLAGKYRLTPDAVELQWQLLPVRLHPVEDYRSWFQWAEQALADRDTEDAHPLALARTLGVPLWSNDNDLRERGVPCYTTANLLRLLES